MLRIMHYSSPFVDLVVFGLQNSLFLLIARVFDSSRFNKSQVLMISVCATVSKNIQHVLSVFKTSSDDLNTLSTGTRRFMFLSGVM